MNRLFPWWNYVLKPSHLFLTVFDCAEGGRFWLEAIHEIIERIFQIWGISSIFFSKMNSKNIGTNQSWIRCFENFLISFRESNWIRYSSTTSRRYDFYSHDVYECQIETHSTEDERLPEARRIVSLSLRKFSFQNLFDYINRFGCVKNFSPEEFSITNF